MFRRPLFVVLLLAAGGVSAQAYKWVDAHGTVHYSESAPPAGTKYSRITLSGGEESGQPSPPPESAAPAATPDPDRPPSPGAPENAGMQDTPENRAKLCSSLKANLDALSGSGPVVMETGGKTATLDAAQRKQQLQHAQAQYGQYCQDQ